MPFKRLFATACLLAAGLLACGPLPPPAATGKPVGVAALQVAAPPPDKGVQITLGPFNVPPGSEVQKGFYFKLPVDHKVWVNRIEIAYPEGSHHCNLFRSKTRNVPDHVIDDFTAKIYDEYDMFANSQSGNLDWKLPPGVGIAFGAHEQMVVQSHWVNGVTQRTPGDQGIVKINLWFADPATITSHLGMAFIINPQITIPPKTAWTATKDVSFSNLAYNEDVKIIAMSGHFHSRGKTFRVNRWKGRDPDLNIGEEVYRNADWDEPPMKLFDPPMDFPKISKLLYHVDYVNDTDKEITFGPKVEVQEHANLFIYFYPGPADGSTLYDAEAAAFQDFTK